MAGSGGNMMALPLTKGAADSGWGVRLEGFYCANRDFALNLDDLQKSGTVFDEIAQIEMEGYALFLALKCEPSNASPHLKQKIVSYRREPSLFFAGLPEFLKSTRALYAHQMALSSSLGSVTLTLLMTREEPPGA